MNKNSSEEFWVLYYGRDIGRRLRAIVDGNEAKTQEQMDALMAQYVGNLVALRPTIRAYIETAAAKVQEAWSESLRLAVAEMVASGEPAAVSVSVS